MKTKITKGIWLTQSLALMVFLVISCTKEPTASFTVSKNKVSVGEVIKFTNTSTDADNYEWDFGDGEKSTEKDPSHSYSVEGTYTVKLTAYNKKKSDVATATITVSKSNSFTYENSKYDLTKGYLEYFGEVTNGEYDYTLILCDDGINITETNEYGTGNLIEIDFTSPSQTSLEPGTYTYSSNGGTMTFDDGEVGLNYNVSSETGTTYSIVGGNVSVAQSGSEYIIEFNLTLTNGKTVEGYYKGNLINYDLSK